MPTVMPHSELVRRAAAWVDTERSLYPCHPLARVLDEAGMRFNLTPKDHLILERLFTLPCEKRKTP